MSIYDYHVLRGLDLSEECVLRLLPTLVTHYFAAGDVVYHKGTTQSAWYHVVSGLVNACIPSTDGKFTSVNIYGQGSWFGEANFVNRQASAKEYICLTPSRLLFLPYADALETFENEPRFARYVARLVAWRNQKNAEQLVLMKIGSPSLRVVMGLAMFAESMSNGASHLPVNDAGECFEIPVKQAVLASMCGVSRGIFSESIQRLAAADFIQLNYATLSLLKIKAWKNFSHAYRQNRLNETKTSMPEILALMGTSAQL